MRQITTSDLEDSLNNHPFAELQRIDFAGLARFGGLGCRVCYGETKAGEPVVDTGYAPYHMKCYALAFEYGQEKAK